MTYIVNVGLWLFCYVGLMVGTHEKLEGFNTDQDIDVVQVITSLQAEVASLKYEAQAREERLVLHSDQYVQQVISSLQAEVASLKSEVRARDKRLVLHSDQDVQLAISSLQTEFASLKSQVTTLQSSILSASLNSSLQGEVTTLKSQVSSLQSQVATSLQAEVSSLTSKVSVLESNILSAPSTMGSVYVRWGRTSCPQNGTEMVYRGRMVGSKYSSTGGGSNSLCLPDDPTWAKYVDGSNVGDKLYGTEIEVSDNIASILFGKIVTNQDVPCAVCRTNRPSYVMIPARANCYPGWTMEYSGYVVSSNERWHKHNDYVCLDSGLEFAPHGAANDDEHIITVVGVACGGGGSLPCPPFVNGREAACVVCSK